MSESVASASGTAPESPADARPRRVAVVYNPTKGDTGALRSAVTAELKAARAAADAAGEAGWADPLWLETTVDDAGHGLTRRAVDEGVDLVLAAGGDGTVRAVASGLRGTGIPLGVVPLGTGNLLARNLGVPLTDARASVHLAITGDDLPIDVGIAELTREGGAASAHAFLVMAGIGIDAAMIANTSPQLKKRVGWLAYVDGGLRSLSSRKFQIHYQVRGHQRHSAHVNSILAGNCGVLPGSIELMPDASLDDGELDIALLQPRTVFGWLLIWRKVTWENRVLRRTAFGRRIIRFTTSDKAKTLSYLRGSSVNVEVSDASAPVELDGDSFGDVTAAHFWADPRALVVRVPPAG